VREEIIQAHSRIRYWSRQDANRYARVSRMMLHERGELMRAVVELSDQYELRRIDGTYQVIRDGEIVPFVQVRRCDDGVRLLVKPDARWLRSESRDTDRRAR